MNRQVILGTASGTALGGGIFAASPGLFVVVVALVILAAIVQSMVTTLMPQESADRLKFWVDRRKHHRELRAGRSKVRCLTCGREVAGAAAEVE